MHPSADRPVRRYPGDGDGAGSCTLVGAPGEWACYRSAAVPGRRYVMGCGVLPLDTSMVIVGMSISFVNTTGDGGRETGDRSQTAGRRSAVSGHRRQKIFIIGGVPWLVNTPIFITMPARHNEQRPALPDDQH